MSFDSTAALLDDTVAQVPRTPDFVDSVFQDDSEEEVFFGSVSEKENKRSAQSFKRRDTICESEVDRRRSYEVLKTKSKFSSLNSNSSRTSSLFHQDNSIVEEDEDVFDSGVQDPEVTSTLECLELLTLPSEDKENRKPETGAEGHLTVLADGHVTGRDFRRSGRSVCCSLPSASKLDQIAQKELGSELKLQQDQNVCLQGEASVPQDEPPVQSLDHELESSPAQDERSHDSPDEGARDSFAKPLDERARAILESDTSFSSQDSDQAAPKDVSQTAAGHYSEQAAVSQVNDQAAVSQDNDQAAAPEVEPTADCLLEGDASRNGSFRLGSDVSKTSEFELGCVSDKLSVGFPSVNQGGSYLDETGMTQGDDSVFLRKSTEGYFTAAESLEGDCTASFTLGHLNLESVSADPSTPTIILTTPSVTDKQIGGDAENRTRDVNLSVHSPDTLNPSPQPLSAVKRFSRRFSTSSVESFTFDSTDEEMILYDMFGEDYDEIVEKMSKVERFELKKKIDALTMEERKQIGERLKLIMEEEGVDDSPRLSGKPSVGSDISPFSLSTGTPASQQDLASPAWNSLTPPVHHPNRQDHVVEAQDLVHAASHGAGDDIGDNQPAAAEGDSSPRFKPSRVSELNLEEDEEEEEGGEVFKPSRVSEVSTALEDDRLPATGVSYPNYLHPSSPSGYNTNYLQHPSSPSGHYPNYLQHTYSSLQRASPQKHCNLQQRSPCKRSPLKPWIPPSASPKKQFQGGQSSFLPLPSTPRTAPSTPRTTPSKLNSVFKTPLSSATKSRLPHHVKGVSSAAVVQSPIGEYIRNNPAPHLVQNVKAKMTADLESTLMENPGEEKENAFPALPTGSYTAAKITQDVEYDATGKDYNLDKAFGQQSTLVKVTRHVDRTRVLNNIRWDEGQLVNVESCCSSPSVARGKEPTKSLLKRTQRDSGLFDESMLDVSVHQTEVIKKLAGRGSRGRGSRGSRGSRGTRGRGRK